MYPSNHRTGDECDHPCRSYPDCACGGYSTAEPVEAPAYQCSQVCPMYPGCECGGYQPRTPPPRTIDPAALRGLPVVDRRRPDPDAALARWLETNPGVALDRVAPRDPAVVRRWRARGWIVREVSGRIRITLPRRKK